MTTKSEQEFFDMDAEEKTRAPLQKYYAIAKKSHDHFDDLIRNCAPRRSVLEYGCGVGNFTFELAAMGARVTGIDISPKAIDVAKGRAEQHGVEGIAFHVMDAENMDFPDASFDVVIGSAILHHLDLKRSAEEILRVLRPGGKALFIEPLGHNPALNMFRFLTPKMRTDDEHPLLAKDLAYLEELMGGAKYTYFHMLTFGALPFLKSKMFWGVTNFLDAADERVFRLVPPLRRWAWFVTMEYAKA